MKRLIVIVMTVIALLALTVPAAAVNTGLGTQVQISTTSGDKPVVLAKWETPDAKPLVNTPSKTQIDCNATYLGTSPIQFWAVVYKNPIQDITLVSVDVYHPATPLIDDPLTPTVVDPIANSFKFEVVLNPYRAIPVSGITQAQAQEALDIYNAAVTAGLVYEHTVPYGNNVPLGETIAQMLAQGEAYLWYGAYIMEYHQPAGTYNVDCFAKDSGPVDASSHLLNTFDYLAVTAFEIDFAGGVNYGNITANGVVSGDQVFGTGGPTLRNIGNTWFKLQIEQDDMGFGMTQPGNVWNVSYDARVGSLIDYPYGGGSTTLYGPVFAKGPTTPDPAGWTTLPGIINLCNTWKVDFSIHIIKSTGASYSGTMWLQALPVAFTDGDGIQHNHPGS